MVLPPENHPFLDDRIRGAISMGVLALFHAGDTRGLGRWWSHQDVVRKNPLVTGPAEHDEVADLARTIRDEQRAEIVLMRGRLADR